MYFSIVLSTDALYQEAMDFFIKQWRSDLLTRAPSSLVWAYLVTQEMYKLWKLWFSFAEWVFSYEWIFFSTSHSNDMIVIAIDSKKVAVDIELFYKWKIAPKFKNSWFFIFSTRKFLSAAMCKRMFGKISGYHNVWNAGNDHNSILSIPLFCDRWTNIKFSYDNSLQMKRTSSSSRH